MDELNPYTAPRTDPVIGPLSGDGPFGHMDFKAVARLRNHSHSIRAIGLLGLFAVLLVGFISLETRLSLIFVGIGGLGLAAAYAAWWRPAWGPVAGILFCGLMLIGFPLGTFIGILGIVAFASGGSLFGPDRFRHPEVEREWRGRRAELRARRVG